jgi:hypothetical protein
VHVYAAVCVEFGLVEILEGPTDGDRKDVGGVESLGFERHRSGEDGTLVNDGCQLLLNSIVNDTGIGGKVQWTDADYRWLRHNTACPSFFAVHGRWHNRRSRVRINQNTKHSCGCFRLQLAAVQIVVERCEERAIAGLVSSAASVMVLFELGLQKAVADEMEWADRGQKALLVATIWSDDPGFFRLFRTPEPGLGIQPAPGTVAAVGRGFSRLGGALQLLGDARAEAVRRSSWWWEFRACPGIPRRCCLLGFHKPRAACASNITSAGGPAGGPS